MWNARADFRDVFTDGVLPELIYANRQTAYSDSHVRPMHRHTDLCELLICCGGRGIYNIDQESYEVREGDVVFYNAGSYHELLAEKKGEIVTCCLGFSRVRLKELGKNRLVEEGGAFVRPSGSEEAFLINLADQIVSSEMNRPEEQLRVKLMAAVFLMTACFLPSEQVRSRSRAASQIAIEAKDYIDAHFTEDLTIEGIARRVGCSESYLAHAFRDFTGYPPLRYALRCRVGQAQTLLISSDLAVEYIGSVTGFDSPAYFCRVFKKMTGQTPQQYRREYLAGLKGSRGQM